MSNDTPDSDGHQAGFGRRAGGPPLKPQPRPAGKPARRRGRRLNAVIAILAVSVLAAIGGTAVWLFYDLPKLPDDKHLWSVAREPGITFEDVNGQVLATRGARNGRKVSIGELPAYVPRAFLAAEDRRFYQHGPVEVRSIIRAAFRNARSDGPDQGASTLTQQIAKTLFLKPDRLLKRKIQEAYIAWRLESQLTKDEVLELYLNRIYFGERPYGLDAASVQYFGHPAQTLTVGEAALLASLPKAPSRLSPTRNMPDALARSRHILTAMREEHWISPAQEAAALASPPGLAPPPSGDQDFGYVLDMAAAEATTIAGENAPDLVVRLTIDPVLQLKAQTIVASAIAREGHAVNASQAALIAMTPDGAIRAVVGGVNHDESPFNRATQARRQPGSSFKPLVYAAALEKGVRPEDLRTDRPVRIGGWQPAN
ncbi:MAG: transglycosylase domain-containing protein, partial [Alphaproteobacteria bacterium]